MKDKPPLVPTQRPHGPMDRPGGAFPEDVSAAVIAYNGMRTLPMCMRGLEDAGCPPRRITVYDVASTDGTGAWLAKHHPGVGVVRLDENRGPNPARNMAVTRAGTPFVVVIDADVQLRPGTVTELRNAIGEDESVAIATPVVLYADRPDTVQYSRSFVHFLAEASADVDGKPLTQLDGETAQVGLASGCAPMIRREAAAGVGLFDERYFFGKTDGEFAYRVTLAGWKIVEPASAQVLHHHHKRGSTYFMHQVCNRWHFMLKDFQWRTWLAILPVLLVHEPALFVLLLAKGRVGDYFAAVRSLGRRLPGLREDRRRVASIRRMHDWQVLRGDRLVVPASFSGGALGVLLGVYRAVLSGYWSLARQVLRMAGPPIRDHGRAVLGAPIGASGRPGNGSSPRNHAA
jgi:GT2 family glycosyltransferase